MLHDIMATPTGILDLFYVYGNGSWKYICTCRNAVMYSGADIAAMAIKGDSGGVVNTLYLEYKNGTPTLPSIGRDRSTTYYTGLASTYGYVRVPVTASATSATSAYYTGNKVTFTGMTDGTTEGPASITDGVSYFFGGALVASPDFTDSTQDVLFSSSAFTDGTGALVSIPKIANAQIGVQWSVTFN